MATQFGSLLKKSFYLWRRGIFGSVCELVMVLVFAGLLILIDSLKTVTTKNQTSYVKQGQFYSMTPSAAGINKAYPNDYLELNEAAMNKTGQMLLKNCNFHDPENVRDGVVALAPKGNPVTTKLEEFFKGVGFRVNWFDSREKMESWMKSDGYGGSGPDGLTTQICFGVSFDEFDTSNAKFNYNLHWNATGRDELKEVQDPKMKNLVIPFETEDTNWYLRNLGSGQVFVQQMVDVLIMREYTSDPAFQINAKMVSFPIPEYKLSNLYTITGGSISVFVIFPLVVTFLRFVYFVLVEKEERIVQNMRNMGMKSVAYYFHWITFYTGVVFVLSVVWTLMVWLTFFKNSNIFLVFLLFFLMGEFFLCLAFFVSGFFTKAKPGVLGSLVLFFILYSGNIGMQAIGEAKEVHLNYFSISPFAALERACNSMILLEASGIGFHFEHFNWLINEYRYSTYVIFTCSEIILLFIFGVYIDLVWPKETGQARHPLFFLGSCINKKKASSESLSLSNIETNSELVEKPNEECKLQIQQNQAVVISQLRKEYSNGKLAVDGLNIQMYSDQIFALLGHNGAGKTTTISMMSGLIDKSSGIINILGLDSSEDRKAIQHVMGICPQTNPIFDSLTVKEHLILYSSIKRKVKHGEAFDRDAEINQVMRDIDLYDKRDYPAGKLSGGQKRKLCVAISFIGDSKVVILDEPTSGMDTYARRHLWEMLKNYKKNRLIILTTHYMDEADYLGDRIGIMAEGKIVTCGTGLFLKEKFGAGYDLTIVKKSPEVDSEQIIKHIEWFMPSSKTVGSISMEVKMQLPTAEAHKFEDLFKSLDENKQNFGIQTYGVSMTTLEEVFLKVALSKSEQEELLNKTEKQIENSSKPNDPQERQSELRQQQVAQESDPEGVVQVVPGNEDKLRKVPVNNPSQEFELEKMRIKNEAAIFKTHFNALCKKRLLYFKRDIKGLICEIILPIAIIFVGLLITMINFISESGDFVVNPSSLRVDHKAIVNQGTGAFLLNRRPIDSLQLESVNAPSLTAMDDYIYQNYDMDRLYAFYVDSFDPATKSYDYTIFLNSTAPYAFNIATNIMSDEIIKSLAGNRQAYIKTRVRALPLTNLWKTFENAADGLIAVFLIGLSFSFIPSSLIMFIVMERENNVKHQQIVSGVSLIAYWSSNYAVDFLKYLICGAFTVIAMNVYNIEIFTETDQYRVVWLLVFLFGSAMILYTYCMSFLFKNPAAAQVFVFIFNFFGGFILMVTSYILRIIPSTRYHSLHWVEYIFRTIPIFDFTFGIFSLANNTVWKFLFGLDELPSPWGWHGARKELIALAVLTILSFVILYKLENWTSRIDTKPNAVHPIISEDRELIGSDDEVAAEESAVKHSQDYVVRVHAMSKVFNIVKGNFCTKKKMIKKKVAVDNISFGVKRGDCFGLLGTNGAGKTTTFKILTGELHQTFGDVRINGSRLDTDMKKIVHQIGYCPQFDALLANLTAQEHLELYAAIKGIPKQLWPEMTEHLLDKLNLRKFKNVQAGTYSGGNKRKLSVAIALLGNPPVVFLDEPSSGMDPEARRFMWSVVASITSEKKSSSVILTTHSMDEAEALSTKLAIMVEGKIKCIGSVQQLKSKYGNGYEIETKIKSPSPEDIEMILLDTDLNQTTSELVNKETLLKCLTKAGLADLLPQIETGAGECSLLYTQLKNTGKVLKSYIAEFIYLQKKSRHVLDFLKSSFGDVTLIESFQSFYRFKIEKDDTLANLFGKLEKNVV